jgi:prepilin-type N-terminal cleavage/methylation domain-containing protein
MRSRHQIFGGAGMTLVEVLIALAILTTIALGVAQLIALATSAMSRARLHTSAVILAAARMDELRSLAWTFAPADRGVPAAPRSDRETDLSRPDRPPGGRGLQPSPAGTLATNTPPYVDFLDAYGRWVGNDTTAPANAVFVRRWSVTPLSDDPDRTLVLHVLVTTNAEDQLRAGAWRRRSGTDALLASVRTRWAQ